MELYKIAAIAKTIYRKILSIETESCRREWQFSIYYAVNRAINEDQLTLIWEQRYSQWNIDHLFRGQESSLHGNHPALSALIENIAETGDSIRIDGHISNGDNIIDHFRCTLDPDMFIPLENIYENGRRILFKDERFDIVNSLLDFEEAGTTPEGQQPEILHAKITSLLEVMEPLREVYARQNETGRNYLETVVGAAIFYLPHPVNDCFSGYCSLNALKEKIKGRRIVKEHITPRKYAAREVLNGVYNLNSFHNDFRGRFQKFMYLTPDENRLTVNYTEPTYDEALLNLGIEKFPVGESHFLKNHRLFMNFISFCQRSVHNVEDLTIESAMRKLGEFLVESRTGLHMK